MQYRIWQDSAAIKCSAVHVQYSNGPYVHDIMLDYLADDLLSMVLLGDVDREGSAEGTLTLGLG